MRIRLSLRTKIVLAMATVVIGWPLEQYVASLRVPRNEAIDRALKEPTSVELKEKAEAARAEFGAWHMGSMGLSFVTLILVMLGGAWVPSFVFPEWLQTASFVAPTRWAIDGLEAMTWRGLGFDTAVAHSAAMLGFSALFALIAVWRFDWEE